MPESRGNEFAFLLLPGFSLPDLANSIEALAVANKLGKSCDYTWRTVSPTSDSVTCSNGAKIPVDGMMSGVDTRACVFVCAFESPWGAGEPTALAWLRRHSRLGGVLGAIGTGATILAQAGLLAGHDFTVHWRALDVFEEFWPDLKPNSSLFLSNGRLHTCAGG